MEKNLKKYICVKKPVKINRIIKDIKYRPSSSVHIKYHRFLSFIHFHLNSRHQRDLGYILALPQTCSVIFGKLFKFPM